MFGWTGKILRIDLTALTASLVAHAAGTAFALWRLLVVRRRRTILRGEEARRSPERPREENGFGFHSVLPGC